MFDCLVPAGAHASRGSGARDLLVGDADALAALQSRVRRAVRGLPLVFGGEDLVKRFVATFAQLTAPCAVEYALAAARRATRSEGARGLILRELTDVEGPFELARPHVIERADVLASVARGRASVATLDETVVIDEALFDALRALPRRASAEEFYRTVVETVAGFEVDTAADEAPERLAAMLAGHGLIRWGSGEGPGFCAADPRTLIYVQWPAGGVAPSWIDNVARTARAHVVGGSPFLPVARVVVPLGAVLDDPARLASGLVRIRSHVFDGSSAVVEVSDGGDAERIPEDIFQRLVAVRREARTPLSVAFRIAGANAERVCAAARRHAAAFLRAGVATDIVLETPAPPTGLVDLLGSPVGPALGVVLGAGFGGAAAWQDQLGAWALRGLDPRACVLGNTAMRLGCLGRDTITIDPAGGSRPGCLLCAGGIARATSRAEADVLRTVVAGLAASDELAPPTFSVQRRRTCL